MIKSHHPRNRYERKQLELKHKKNRPAIVDVEVLTEEANHELRRGIFEEDKETTEDRSNPENNQS